VNAVVHLFLSYTLLGSLVLAIGALEEHPAILLTLALVLYIYMFRSLYKFLQKEGDEL
jgi:hypothetical protein